MKTIKNRILTFVLAIAMALGTLFTAVPAVAVYAEEPTNDTHNEYTGSDVGFFKEDGSAFGMFAKQDGTKIVQDGDYIEIYYVPKNKTTYNSIHWGLITDENLSRDIDFGNGFWKFSIAAENCGFRLPIAPIKADGGTTSTQYYLCIPAQDHIPMIADYSGVDEALAEVPEDLSIYTEESVQALEAALEATEAEDFRYYSEEEQDTVDAVATAISEAVAGLVEFRIVELEITNNTGMFKAVKANLEIIGDDTTLVMALSGSGYKELFKGTYEAAVANGDGTADNGNDSWVHSYVNADGQLEFRIPIEDGETYVPCVAVSNSYYNNYLKSENSLERAFFPRQFTIDTDAATIVTGDYNETTDFTVTSNLADFKVAETASTEVVGGPNSNNYKVAPTLVMEDDTYDSVTYPTVVDGVLGTATAELTDGKFAISMLNAAKKEAFKDKTPIEMTFHVAEDSPYKEAGTDVVRTVTIDKMAKTIEIDGEPLVDTRIAYTGTDVGLFKEDGTTAFGMFAKQDGTKIVQDGDYIEIYYVPKNKTTYNSIHWGLITDENLSRDIDFGNGFWKFSIAAENCGFGLPVAPIKADGGTTSTQYYLCIPAQDHIPMIADYSGVDEALAEVPADLSIYTEESVQALQTALEATEAADFRYYSEEEQDTVDAVATAISEAVVGLEKKIVPLPDITLGQTSFTYTGKEIRPAVTIGNLVEGTDYDVEYSNNINAGTATVTVTGKNFYEGTKTASFKIEPKKLAASAVTLAKTAYTYTGKAISPAATVKDGTSKLAKGKDFTVSYSNNKAAGTATATIKGTGNYTGTVKKTYKIDAKKLTASMVTLAKTSYAYTGKAISPAVTVKDGTSKLAKGTAFTVKYSKNKAVGTATITITGKGNYKGTVKKTFKIIYKGWNKVKGKWYYFNNSGKKKIGWIKLKNKKYYTDKKGVRVTGWLKISGKWYYFDKNGVMATGTKKISGKTYKFKSNGVWVK